MIRLRGIEKHFDTKAGRMYVLRRIDLDIREGEFLTIMGPSGAGKSTLLGILGLLDAEWSGEYWFGDEAVHRMNLRQRADLNKRNIGFVFQQYHLLDNLTVYENLEIPLSYRNVSRSERQAIVADVLDRFQIVGKKDLFPNQLSGGQQQLVAVARAVVASPRLILADEPTGNLHSAQAREIMELFRKLNNEGTTIDQVTHSEQNASYGHGVIELLDGWIAGESAEQSEGDAQGEAGLPPWCAPSLRRHGCQPERRRLVQLLGQLEQQRMHGRVPVRRIRGETPHHDALEGCADVGRELAHRWWRNAPDLRVVTRVVVGGGFLLIDMPEGPAAGEHLVEQSAEAVDVACARERLATHVLRRHVRRGADASHGTSLVADATHGIEVDDHGHAVAQQHVRGLHVEVEEAAAVQVIECGADVDCNAHGVVRLEAPVPAVLDHVEQRRPLEVLHEQKRQAVVLAAPEAAHDCRVPDLAEDTRLATQRGERRTVVASPGRDDLAGERAPLVRAPHLVELPEAAHGQVADDREITGDPVTGCICEAAARGGRATAVRLQQAEPSRLRDRRLFHRSVRAPLRSWSTLSRIRASGAGFARYRSQQPEARIASWSAAPASPVRTRIGTGAGCVSRFLQMPASIPSIDGSWPTRITRSGRAVRPSAIPSSPRRAVSTSCSTLSS